jgi:hypothetical protein
MQTGKNPPSAELCDCGYSFVTGIVTPTLPHYSAEDAPPQIAAIFNRLGWIELITSVIAFIDLFVSAKIIWAFGALGGGGSPAP